MSKDKPEKPLDPSSLTPAARQMLQEESLSVEEQKALGIDTGPVLIVSTAPRGLRPKPKPKKD
jgi:hypothetical protein